MTDANTSSSTAFSTPFSHLQHLLILGWKTGQSQDKAEPGRDPNTRRKRGAPGACARDRERGRDGVLGRARQLRLPTMAAQGGLQLRVSSRRRRKTRRRERGGALLSVTLRGAPPRREKRERKRDSSTDRPTDRSSLAWVADLFCSSLHLAARAGTRRGHHLVLLSTLCWVSRIAISRTSTWSTLLLLRGRGSSLAT